MASFGDSALVNAAAPAAAAGVHRAAHVSAAAVTAVRYLGNAASLFAVLVPVWTYVRPALKGKGIGDRTIYGMIAVFYGAMFWLIYAIPEVHRDTFTLVVNSVNGGVQILYNCVYLWKVPAGDSKDYAKLALWVFVPLAFIIGFLFVMILVVAHVWSRKIAGIVAATISTGMFVVGNVDMVMLKLQQRSPFSMPQLLANLCACCIWTSYAFLFSPCNYYSAIPNMTGVGVTSGQIISHVLHTRRQGNQPAGPAAGAANNVASAAAAAASAAANVAPVAAADAAAAANIAPVAAANNMV